MSLGVASTTSAALKLYNSSSANSVSIASGNNTASWTMTLPPDDGAANQFLQTDGSGNTIWAAAAAGTINTGTAGQITYYSGTNALSGTTTGTGVLTAISYNTNTAGGVLVPAAALTASAIVLGGGSGTGPATTTTGTGVVTAIGNAVNTAGGLLAPAAALTANDLVVGGGSGTGPSTVTTGTGVVTALGVNTGSAGAFVVNGGALGTPSSGALTNCTSVPVNQATGTLPVANGGTGLTSGTSGGVLYYSATGTLASSAALAASALVIGGGAGVAPSTTTTAAGILTFLGTPSSANLATAVTDETGSGSLVFATSPTLTTPRLAGSSSGYTSFASANSSATNYTATFPAENMTVGYRNIPPVGTKSSGAYSLATGDVGRYVQVTGGSITIPDTTFAEGDVVSIFNNTSGNITLTCSITTAYIAGTDSDKATMTLATRGVATILFISSTVCVVSGNVS
jgi:hypothetical protein